MSESSNVAWPELPYDEWRATQETLHLWMQVVGKVRLGLTPWLNHSWHVPLYVTARGLGTSPIPYHSLVFEINFDFIAGTLDILVSDGNVRRLPLRSQTVADFYATTLSALGELGIEAYIDDFPCEIANATAFSKDRAHATYDSRFALRFWQALVQSDRVFKQFRTGFLGKSSPVHFFWGSFDLAVTRFSGRRAPPFQGNVPGMNVDIMREAYSHEVSSAGFWPGGNGVDASFYSYAYPTADAFRHAKVEPDAAVFNEALGEFLLPYDVVRRSPNPDATLLEFLQSTYAAAADTAHWDRGALECSQGISGTPRRVDPL